MLPNFIVIGAQKAGSTWVAETLAHHPDVFMYPTELPYFENPDFQEHDVAWLESHFRAVTNQSMVGMKRPNLLGLPECPAHIRAIVPSAKLITMLRNPIERAVSAYFHLMRSGLMPITPMEEGMRNILSGAWDHSWPAARLHVLEFGFYHQHIERYLTQFPRAQLLVVLYDRLRTGANELFRQMCRFLEIRAIDGTVTLERRPMEGSYSIVRQRLMAPLRVLHRGVTANRMRTFGKRGPFALPARVASHGIDRYVLARFFPAQRPTPSVEIQEQLIALYRNDVEALGAFLGEDLSHWLRVREPRGS